MRVSTASLRLVRVTRVVNATYLILSTYLRRTSKYVIFRMPLRRNKGRPPNSDRSVAPSTLTRLLIIITRIRKKKKRSRNTVWFNLVYVINCSEMFIRLSNLFVNKRYYCVDHKLRLEMFVNCYNSGLKKY